ncbi:hypothetical protein SAY86_004586 [Trapa natans]|uniref:Protein SET n=1 Tax=Trapa natans TaxID=22666 RepID=A0AAN7RFP6_TRANT|nr:hypothetical protein SAY86_004586 [Trapa natans]
MVNYLAKKARIVATEKVDEDHLLSIQKLHEIQNELEMINEEEDREKPGEIKAKYNEMRRPIYDKRNKIIMSIYKFWLFAFRSHPTLCQLLTEDDQKIFEYLTSLEVENFKDVKSGYSITFNFASNPYFEDTKLTKTFNFLEDGSKQITATSIKWKERQGLTTGDAQEKKGKKRLLTQNSFFDWFSNSERKNVVGNINDDDDEEDDDDDIDEGKGNDNEGDGNDEEDKTNLFDIDDSDEDDSEGKEGSDWDEDNGDEGDEENGWN